MDLVASSFGKWKNRISAPILEAYIFQLLEFSDRFGGELVERSQAVIGEHIKIPTIYAILKRSTDLGLIEVTYRNTKTGITRGTSRKYYTLTKYGREYIDIIVKHLSTLTSFLDQSLTKQNGGPKIES